MDTLGEDLVLLSIRSGKGRLATSEKIDYGLMGSELVRLAASRRIEIRSDRVIVVDQTPLGDAELDAALHSLIRARRPPRPEAWVSFPRPGIRQAYLGRLASSGVVRAEAGRLFGKRWFIVDLALASARASLDAIAFSTGPVSTAQAAYGGLASAVGLGRVLYPPGPAGTAARKRLGEIGTGQQTTVAVADAIAAGHAAQAASS